MATPLLRAAGVHARLWLDRAKSSRAKDRETESVLPKLRLLFVVNKDEEYPEIA